MQLLLEENGKWEFGHESHEKTAISNIDVQNYFNWNINHVL